MRTRGRPVTVPGEDIRKIVSLYSQRLSYSSISELTGYSRWTVDKILKESRGETMYLRTRGKKLQPDPRSVAEFLDELKSELSDAVDEIEAMTGAIIRYNGELQQLCEGAIRVSAMHNGLEAGISTFETMKQRLDSYKTQIEELDQANVESSHVG